MLATFSRSTAIFLVLLFSFFAAATANSQSPPDRPRNASASSEPPSDGSAFAANPATWKEQCAANLPGSSTSFVRSPRPELPPWENDLADDRDLPSHPVTCATQLLLAQRASLRNSAASQLSASANPSSKSALSSPSPNSPPPPSSIALFAASPSPTNTASLPVLSPAADPTSALLASFGKHGATIARGRAVALEILSSANACTEWYQTKDPTPALTFQSLTFSIDRHGPQTIFESPLSNSLELLRQPYVARATQDSGPYSEIIINANGAFFRVLGNVQKLQAQDAPGVLGGTHLLTVGYYTGSTLEAQVVTLLHEFGHILDLLPPDSDDLDGSSARNTDQVLRHCRPEVEAYSKQARQSAKR